MVIVHKQRKLKRYIHGKGIINDIKKKHVHGKGIVDTIIPFISKIAPAIKQTSELVKNVSDTAKKINEIKNTIREMRKKKITNKDESERSSRLGTGFRYV